MIVNIEHKQTTYTTTTFEAEIPDMPNELVHDYVVEHYDELQQKADDDPDSDIDTAETYGNPEIEVTNQFGEPIEI